MFTLNQLKGELFKRYKEDVELDILEKCIHIWNIEPSYKEDQERIFFDEKKLHQVYRGLKLQKEGYEPNIILKILNKKNQLNKTKNAGQEPAQRVIEKVEEVLEQREKQTATAKSSTATEQKVKKVSANNTQKLVSHLSKTISDNVTREILDYLKNGELVQDIIDTSALKRDNEILSKQVEELIEVNSSLENQIFSLEVENSSYKKIWKSFYIKFE